MPELRALALVHGHGVAGFVSGQAGRGEGGEAVLRREVDAKGVAGREGDACVAVEQAQAVVVFENHDGAARVPSVPCRRAKCLAGQAVQGLGAAGALADRRQQAQGAERLEGPDGVRFSAQSLE